MPYKIVKHAHGDYSVINASSGKVKAKHTSKAKAEAQVRLLHSKEKK
jgi:hypothetical protein